MNYLKKKDNRDVTIDLLKVIAIFLIVNSHCAVFFPSGLKLLATGGAIGDALFFFASGYTLLLGGGNNPTFLNWYKRRINRIYPSVFAWAFIASLCYTLFAIGTEKTMFEIIVSGGGWFVSCIMIYYIPFYFIKKNFLKYVNWLFVAVSIIVIVWYVIILDESLNIYATGSYFTRFAFFLFMLLGAICGYRDKLSDNSSGYSIKKDLLYFMGLIISLAVFNGLKLVLLKQMIPYSLNILSMVALFGVIYFIFKVCRCGWVRRLIKGEKSSNIIYALSMLCLEVYLCRNVIIEQFEKMAFPLRYLILFVAILVVAYIVKILANLFIAIFDDKEIKVRSLFTI